MCVCQSLEAIQSNQSINSLVEAECTVALLAQLACFHREWRFSLPIVFDSLKVTMSGIALYMHLLTTQLYSETSWLVVSGLFVSTQSATVAVSFGGCKCCVSSCSQWCVYQGSLLFSLYVRKLFIQSGIERFTLWV